MTQTHSNLKKRKREREEWERRGWPWEDYESGKESRVTGTGPAVTGVTWTGIATASSARVQFHHN